jgi:hypothetical protein
MAKMNFNVNRQVSNAALIHKNNVQNRQTSAGLPFSAKTVVFGTGVGTGTSAGTSTSTGRGKGTCTGVVQKEA